jgi:uncharacterized protein with NRDE domain
MCVIFIANRVNKKYPLIVLANRDEFYDRPTAAAARWEDHPEIFAGRDLVAGGTWLGTTDSGRFGAVTNYREPGASKGDRSRGALVSDFLVSEQSPIDYLERVRADADRYSGFNLIVGIAGKELHYYSNRASEVQQLNKGCYGLSNHLLNSSWPKVTNGLSRFEKLVSKEQIQVSDCFQLLSDKTLAADSDLPDTGVGIERERELSPIFIRTPNYGTRSSTVVLFHDDRRIDFEEKVFV